MYSIHLPKLPDMYYRHISHALKNLKVSKVFNHYAAHAAAPYYPSGLFKATCCFDVFLCLKA